MTDPTSIRTELARFATLLEAIGQELAKAEAEASQAKADYEVAHAEALLRSQARSRDLREAEARLAVRDLAHRHLISHGRVAALKSRERTASAAASLVQSDARILVAIDSFPTSHGGSA